MRFLNVCGRWYSVLFFFYANSNRWKEWGGRSGNPGGKIRLPHPSLAGSIWMNSGEKEDCRKLSFGVYKVKRLNDIQLL